MRNMVEGRGQKYRFFFHRMIDVNKMKSIIEKIHIGGIWV